MRQLFLIIQQFLKLLFNPVYLKYNLMMSNLVSEEVIQALVFLRALVGFCIREVVRAFLRVYDNTLGPRFNDFIFWQITFLIAYIFVQRFPGPVYDLLHDDAFLARYYDVYLPFIESYIDWGVAIVAVGKNAVWWLIFQVFLFLSIIIPVLIGVAYLTLAERKIMAAIQRRVGPNVVGVWGLIQPLADGLKLVVKQTIIPNKAQRLLFLFAPVYTFALALSAWAVIPFNKNIVLANLELGVIYLLAVSTLGVYGLIIAGWSSNSKYAFLGALRAAAQIISYDVSMGLILLCLLLSTSTCNLTAIVEFQATTWFIIIYWPLAIIFFISILAETNRSPFDLTEAEAELVSGYNVEYSAVGFALFFLAEYSNILMISVYFSLLFLGGWYAPLWLDFWFVPGSLWLGLKTAGVAYVFIWVRATVPRYRYDQLMALGWKVFLPLALGFFICINCIQMMFKTNSIVDLETYLMFLGRLLYYSYGLYLCVLIWVENLFAIRDKVYAVVEFFSDVRILIVLILTIDLSIYEFELYHELYDVINLFLL